jgi:hypothetical protein
MYKVSRNVRVKLFFNFLMSISEKHRKILVASDATVTTVTNDANDANVTIYIASTKQTFYDIMPKTEHCSSQGGWSVLLNSG